jgi:hypothetical protein
MQLKHSCFQSPSYFLNVKQKKGMLSLFLVIKYDFLSVPISKKASKNPDNWAFYSPKGDIVLVHGNGSLIGITLTSRSTILHIQVSQKVVEILLTFQVAKMT